MKMHKKTAQRKMTELEILKSKAIAKEVVLQMKEYFVLKNQCVTDMCGIKLNIDSLKIRIAVYALVIVCALAFTSENLNIGLITKLLMP